MKTAGLAWLGSHGLARRALARHGIRIVVEGAGRETDVRAMHLVVEKGERSYAHVDTIVEDDGLLAQLVATAKREQETWFHKYQQLRKLTQFAPLFDEIERVVVHPHREAAE